jgi:hypothetical protein
MLLYVALMTSSGNQTVFNRSGIGCVLQAGCRILVMLLVMELHIPLMATLPPGLTCDCRVQKTKVPDYAVRTAKIRK